MALTTSRCAGLDGVDGVDGVGWDFAGVVVDDCEGWDFDGVAVDGWDGWDFDGVVAAVLGGVGILGTSGAGWCKSVGFVKDRKYTWFSWFNVGGCWATNFAPIAPLATMPISYGTQRTLFRLCRLADAIRKFCCLLVKTLCNTETAPWAALCTSALAFPETRSL